MACIIILGIFVQFWLSLSGHIQINQNWRIFHFNTIKGFVLIIPGKISGKFSGKLPIVIFNHLSVAIFDKEDYFSGNYE